MKWRPYQKYKDSGVEWLGEIPEHWSGTALKRWVEVKITDGPHETPEFIDEGIPFASADAVRNGRIDFDFKRGYIRPELHVRYIRKVHPKRDDIFMVKSGATTGKLAIVDVDFEFSVWSPLALIRANPEKITPNFLFSALHADYIQNQVQRTWSEGTQPNISMAAIERLYVVAPPLSEQRAIAAFLDRKTAHIDALIAKKERQIELFQEKRAALISHAVTKGLDPDVPMKDSGIEWLGEVPEHWARVQLGYLTRVLNGSTPSRNRTDYWTDGTIPWLSSGKVNDDVIIEPSELITKIALRECSLEVIPSGSVVIGLVGQGRTRGMAAIMGIDATINQNMAAMIPQSKLRGRFLHYVLQQMYNPIREYGRGANQAALNCEVVAAIQIPVPPVHEQENIANYLDIQNARFAAICNGIKDSLTILREYRTALISAAVTGKIDLRPGATHFLKCVAPDAPDAPS